MSRITINQFTSDLDYMFFSFFKNLRLPIAYVSRLYTFGVASFMFCSSLMLYRLVGMNLRKICIFLAAIILFVLVNDFNFSVSIYLDIATATTPITKEFYLNIWRACGIYTEVLFNFFVLAPIIILVFQCLKNKIYLNRQYDLVLLSVIIILHGFVFVILRNVYSHIWFSNQNFSKVPVSYGQAVGNFTIPAVFVIVFVVVSILSFRVKPIYSFNLITHGQWLEENTIFNNNIGMTLHSYKNSFIALRQHMELIRVYVQREDFSNVEKHLDIGNDIVNTQLDSITKSLKNLRNSKMTPEKINIVDCLKNALKNASENTKIYLPIASECMILGDFETISEMFLNILYNAEYAMKEQENPEITVNLIIEGDFCEIDITDNGCGIPKQNIKKVFTPFYSTKPTMAFGGLGLSFAKSVIKAHRGDIRLKSKENSYTTVKIVFPIYKEKGRKVII